MIVIRATGRGSRGDRTALPPVENPRPGLGRCLHRLGAWLLLVVLASGCGVRVEELLGVIEERHYSGPIVFSAEGKTLALAGREGRGQVDLWSLGEKPVRQVVVSPSNPDGMRALHFAFSKDGRSLAVEYQERGVSLWDLNAKKERAFIPLETHRWVSDMAFVDDRTLVAIVASWPDKTVVKPGSNLSAVRWDAATGKELAAQTFDPTLDFNALSPDGRFASLGTRTGQTVFDLSTGKPVFTSTFGVLDVERGPDRGDFVFADDGSILVNYSAVNLNVLEIPSGKPLHRFACPVDRDPASHGLSLAADKRLLAVGRFRGESDVGLIELGTGKVVAAFDVAPPEMICQNVRFVPGGRLLATDTFGGNSRDQPVLPLLRFWKLPTAESARLIR